MNRFVVSTVAALAASLASPAFAAHMASASQDRNTLRVVERRDYIDVQRRYTWEWQDKSGVRRTHTARNERRTRSLPYLHYLARYWHKQHRLAQLHYKRTHRQISYGSRSLTISTGGSNVAIGQAMAAAYGWTGGEWSALYTLWNYESGWSTTASNPSGACGIPQNISGCSSYDAASQIAWGLSYIRGRYGSPSSALAHFYSTNWY